MSGNHCVIPKPLGVFVKLCNGLPQLLSVFIGDYCWLGNLEKSQDSEDCKVICLISLDSQPRGFLFAPIIPHQP